MAKVVRVAMGYGLQVVGQVHTHPKLAFHSDGDELGARIRYSGYVSIVLPEYGCALPDISEAAMFMYLAGKGFQPLDRDSVFAVPEKAE
jgi:hypothetical protein